MLQYKILSAQQLYTVSPPKSTNHPKIITLPANKTSVCIPGIDRRITVFAVK